MGILTFKGGVHPYDGKELSKNSPVVKYLPKGDMVYPLSQHIGAPAAAIVQKGDHVLAGQKIADAAGFVSSPIHSSVSGTVKGIEPRLTATGSMVNSIIIENDQQYESVELVGLCTDICVISNAMLCKAAFPEANIVIDAALCACVTPESHDTALNAMRLCQMEILHQGEEPWRK